MSIIRRAECIFDIDSAVMSSAVELTVNHFQLWSQDPLDCKTVATKTTCQNALMHLVMDTFFTTERKKKPVLVTALQQRFIGHVNCGSHDSLTIVQKICSSIRIQSWLSLITDTPGAIVAGW